MPLTKASAGVLNIDDLYGFRNRIINGAMVIDQRYNGSGNTLVSATETFVVDRFVAYKDAGTITSGQSSVAPTGFKNSIIWSVGTGATATSNQYFFLKQHIEGFNTADLEFGTANAKTITFSFWVRASITGTHSGSINNGAANRAYGFTYTINVANTWEYKSITIPGDTSGTWVGATNGIGLRVYWDLGCHSSVRNSSANVWGNGALVGVAGTTSISATTGATFYVTGVQLEVGSVATPFERRPYGMELALCQRYYYRITLTGGNFTGMGRAFSSTQCIAPTIFPCTMRTAPTALEQNGTASDYGVGYGAGSASGCSSVPAFNTATVEGAYTTFTIASGLTVGDAVNAYRGANSPYLGWSAEL